MNSRVGRITAVAGLAALTVFAAACTKAQNSGSGGGTNNSQGAQQVATSTNNGPTCNYQKYGASKLDLTKATVGFSQSESTSNPFRSTETDSVTQQAQKLGIKLIQRNANADVNAQNSQIEEMIAQGAQVLIVAPENSDGLKPALDAGQGQAHPGADHRQDRDRHRLLGLHRLPRLGLLPPGADRRRRPRRRHQRHRERGDAARQLRQQRDHRPHQRLPGRDQGQVPEHEGGRAADRELRRDHRPERDGAVAAEQPEHQRGLRRERRDGASARSRRSRRPARTRARTSRSCRSTAPSRRAGRRRTARWSRTSRPTRASARSPSRR